MDVLKTDFGIHAEIDVALNGNIITVDFSRLLAESRLGKAIFKGTSVLDFLEIESATPMDNGIEIKTKWNVVSTAKGKLAMVLGKSNQGS